LTNAVDLYHLCSQNSCFSFCQYFLIAILFIFFFQAEDGIRDRNVTGVQTCALPIWLQHDRERGLEAVRRQGPLLLQELPPTLPSVGQAGRHRRRVREGAEPGGLLEALQELLREPGPDE